MDKTDAANCANATVKITGSSSSCRRASESHASASISISSFTAEAKTKSGNIAKHSSNDNSSRTVSVASSKSSKNGNISKNTFNDNYYSSPYSRFRPNRYFVLTDRSYTRRDVISDLEKDGRSYRFAITREGMKEKYSEVYPYHL